MAQIWELVRMLYYVVLVTLPTTLPVILISGFCVYIMASSARENSSSRPFYWASGALMIIWLLVISFALLERAEGGNGIQAVRLGFPVLVFTLPFVLYLIVRTMRAGIAKVTGKLKSLSNYLGRR